MQIEFARYRVCSSFTIEFRDRNMELAPQVACEQ